MPDVVFLAVVTVIIALIFDFVNGFHDAANSISTVVATRVLTPLQAVLMAGLWNFVGAFVFGVAVAKTIGSGIIIRDAAVTHVILPALIGAIIWNIITWRLGLPSSSSHALVGGLVGAAIAFGGIGAIIFSGLNKVLIFIVLAPVIGVIGSVIFTVVVFSISKKFSPVSVNMWFKRLQLISASGYSLGHGTNDAQKTMGVIAAVLFSAGFIDSFRIDRWVIIAAYTAIALGTFAGGWRIVKTMGNRLTKLRPVDGFCAESGGALTLLGASHFGIPVSTTHVIAGAIVGVGATKRASGVRWGVARNIIIGWIITIPMSALFAAVSYMAISRVLW
ncbi:inorganic phosphate transporter [Candidatus Woesearchaeota archaeon]|nr:inorganic phosphate transporter [Candidatus Woesearchaeota archaeon]